MSVDTYVQRAQCHVRDELAAVREKREALDEFVGEVEAVATEAKSTTSSGASTTAGVQSRGSSVSESGCRQVRAAFTETVRPHSVADLDGGEPLLETIREELSAPVAAALASTTAAAFTPELKETVVAEARARRREAAAFERALEREAAQLAEAANAVDDVVGWLVDVDETPLTALDFRGLARRYERLAARRDRCEDLAERRQAFLRESTNDGADAGVRHRQLVDYLYEDFPVDHPVLATVANVDATCRDCQRAVRAHLVRRA